MGKTRVGIVTYDFYPFIGGQGRHTLELWRRLKDDPALELHVFSPARNRLPRHHRQADALGRWGRHLSFSLVAGLRMQAWRRLYGIDLFHLNGGPGGVMLLGRPSAPVLYTVHHTYAQQASLVPGQRWKWLLSALERPCYRRATRLVADSPSTARSLVQDLGIASPRVSVIPSGVDTRLFRRLPVPRQPGCLLYVGRFDDRKGVRFLMESLPAILRLAPQAHLSLIGSGPLQGELESLVVSLGVGRHITFLGSVSNQELARWYNRAVVVVVPSRFEGFGLTALEALACGTPVVATNVDGLRDLPLGNGALVPFGDEGALAAAVARFADGRAVAGRGGTTGVREAYGWDGVASRYREVYLETAFVEGVSRPARGARSR